MSGVSLVRCSDYGPESIRASLMEVWAKLGGIGNFVKPGMSVCLKVNLLMRSSPEAAVTTHPALVEAVAAAVRQAGGRAVILDSPGGPYTREFLKGIYDDCGMTVAAQAAGAEINYDLSEEEVANPAGKLLKRLTLLRPLLRADLVINMPKLKAHGFMVYTGAIKNMFGAVPGMHKPEYHMKMPAQKDFADALIDIYLAIKPGLQIMDAVVGMEGEGPSAGRPRQIGCLLAGVDGFALDLAAAKLIGLRPEKAPVLAQAMARGLCAGWEQLEIAGEDPLQMGIGDFDLPEAGRSAINDLSKSWLLRSLVRLIKPKPVFDRKVCRGCSVCVQNCPAKVIRMEAARPRADLNRCIRCFCCQELCPAKAVSIKRSLAGDFLLFKVAPLLAGLVRKKMTNREMGSMS